MRSIELVRFFGRVSGREEKKRKEKKRKAKRRGKRESCLILNVDGVHMTDHSESSFANAISGSQTT